MQPQKDFTDVLTLMAGDLQEPIWQTVAIFNPTKVNNILV